MVKFARKQTYGNLDRVIFFDTVSCLREGQLVQTGLCGTTSTKNNSYDRKCNVYIGGSKEKGQHKPFKKKKKKANLSHPHENSYKLNFFLVTKSNCTTVFYLQHFKMSHDTESNGNSTSINCPLIVLCIPSCSLLPTASCLHHTLIDGPQPNTELSLSAKKTTVNSPALPKTKYLSTHAFNSRHKTFFFFFYSDTSALCMFYVTLCSTVKSRYGWIQRNISSL